MTYKCKHFLTTFFCSLIAITLSEACRSVDFTDAIAHSSTSSLQELPSVTESTLKISPNAVDKPSPEKTEMEKVVKIAEEMIPLSEEDRLISRGQASDEALKKFFRRGNKKLSDRVLSSVINHYKRESKVEGINYDIAFVQMCLETGYLKSQMSRNAHNFCGLGAVDGNTSRRLSFPSISLGVRAHIQHLRAYASKENLRGSNVDPRFRFIYYRGCAPRIEGLTGRWASDPHYGRKLKLMLKKLGSIEAEVRLQQAQTS